MLLDKMSNIVHKLQVTISLFLKFGSEMLALRDNMLFLHFLVVLVLDRCSVETFIRNFCNSTGS